MLSRLTSPFSVRSIILRIDLAASLSVLFGQSQASSIPTNVGINAVMKRKDSNYVGILSYQGEAATAQTSVNILYL